MRERPWSPESKTSARSGFQAVLPVGVLLVVRFLGSAMKMIGDALSAV
jgi:hypothetical protein